MRRQRTGPSVAALALTTALVAAVHWAVLLGGPDLLQVSLSSPKISTAPLQTRTITVPAATPGPAARKPTGPRPPAQPVPPQPTAAPAAIFPSAPVDNTSPPTPAAEAQPPANAEVAAQTATPTEPAALPPPAPLGLTVGALPAPVLLSYKLTGQEKGLTYYASGVLRWQHTATNYEASLTIKAFLLGSRVFSSVGSVGPQGLMPLRHSDKWRGEKATHFDAENHLIHFSNNKPSAELQAGAQDQVSLYVQLAAAMAGDPERFKPGTSVSIQTATINDALPWTLTLQAEENVQLDGKPVPTLKWVCLPRGKYDTQVELWLSRAHAWMPVRIRITQVNGSFIDMAMDSIQPLAPLANAADKS